MRLGRPTLWARVTGFRGDGASDRLGVYHILFTLGLAALGVSFLAGTRALVAEGSRREFQADPLAQANRLAEQGLLQRAVGQCRMAALIDPSAPATWYTLGQLLMRTGGYEDAEQAFERALRVNPGLVEAWIGWGDAALDRKRPSEAVARFSQALVMAPRSAAAHNGLGIALASLGQMDRAIDHFAAAVEASGDPSIRANLERARAEKGGGPAGPRSAPRP